MILLAQEQQTFEGYQALGAHYDFQYDLVNPYNIEALREPGHFFYPWVGSTTAWMVYCLLVGLLVLWVFFRVNDAAVFRNVGAALVGMGFTLGLFYRTAFPHPFGLLLATALSFLLVVNLNAVLAVAAVQKLPYFGLDDKLLLDPHDGSVRPPVLYVLGALLILGPYMALGPWRDFLFALCGHSDFLVWVALLALIALTGIAGYEEIPWKNLPNPTVLGGGSLRELAPIFSMPGPATRGEVVLVGVAICVGYGATLLLFKGRISGADILGLFFLTTLAFNIIRAELNRAVLTESSAQKPVRRGPWS